MESEFEDYKWFAAYDERQQKEIVFNTVYADSFNHGTSDHNMRIIIADMAEQLVDYEDRLKAFGYDG